MTDVLDESLLRSLIASTGCDPTSDGLADTPRRWIAALAEMTGGQHIDPAAFLRVIFHPDHSTDEMIVLRRVGFVSLCEHHLLPFIGAATVGYIPAPGAGVVGLSKLARVVDGFARRLQLQERMTTQIADCLQVNLDTVGVAVTLSATHTCLAIRGARKDGAQMITSVTRGAFRDEPSARAEFFALARE